MVTDEDEGVALCPICDGQGHDDDAVTCETCAGNGEVVVDWDRYLGIRPALTPDRTGGDHG
jgi:DnaJ-class molecular chaperone